MNIISYPTKLELLKALQKISRAKSPRAKMGNCAGSYLFVNDRLGIRYILDASNIKIIAKALEVNEKVLMMRFCHYNRCDYYYFDQPHCKIYIENETKSLERKSKIKIIMQSLSL
ncbi:hypothetical protein [Hymenobacter lapidiphilus]|uniref:hypothetical protein n=1 Tax=Hymenobacter sp. CCM 8763 TaxID=2303334 RepID=UPI0011C13AA6|nr:hypothetical protein [Hymenobacter sp. CCM 8763]